MLSGVAVEQVEGNRVLLITSSRRGAITYPDRGGAYQCFDQVGVIGAMAKYSACADQAGRVPELCAPPCAPPGTAAPAWCTWTCPRT